MNLLLNSMKPLTRKQTGCLTNPYFLYLFTSNPYKCVVSAVFSLHLLLSIHYFTPPRTSLLKTFCSEVERWVKFYFWKHFPLCVNRQWSPTGESPGLFEGASEEDLGVLSLQVSLPPSFCTLCLSSNTMDQQHGMLLAAKGRPILSHLGRPTVRFACHTFGCWRNLARTVTFSFGIIDLKVK